MISRRRLALAIALIAACAVLSVFGGVRFGARGVWDRTQVGMLVMAAGALIGAFGVIGGVER